MPFNQFTTRFAATGDASEILLVEGGDLVAVQALPEDNTPTTSWIFCQLWIVSMETPTPTPIFLLASGYLGETQAVTWDGRIPLEPTYGIQCRIWGDDAHAVRTTILVDRG